MDTWNYEAENRVWQRVMHRGSTDFYAMAALEQFICNQCAALYRRGYRQKEMQRIYREAKARRRTLEAMAAQAGEPKPEYGGTSPRPQLGVLIDALGRAAWAYDPAHPIYGPAFGQMRAECAAAQRRLLAKGK